MPALLVIHDAAGRDVEIWSYRALEEVILRTAYAFRATHSLRAGSRVAIRLRNRTSYALAFFGAIAAGLIPISISPDLTERECGSSGGGLSGTASAGSVSSSSSGGPTTAASGQPLFRRALRRAASSALRPSVRLE